MFTNIYIISDFGFLLPIYIYIYIQRNCVNVSLGRMLVWRMETNQMLDVSPKCWSCWQPVFMYVLVL